MTVTDNSDLRSTAVIYILDQQRYLKTRADFHIIRFSTTRSSWVAMDSDLVKTKEHLKGLSFKRRDVSYVFFVATEGRPNALFRFILQS
jgi:hypothetical protein